MRINEIFYSLQGEGFLAGLPSTFIRLAGCRLRCRWCDTKYAWDESAGQHLTIEKIIQAVKGYEAGFVVVTGGEPMINSDLPQLVKALKAADKHITIETAGIAFIPDMPCDLMSISPKLENSTPTDPDIVAAGHKYKPDTAVLSELIDRYRYQLKFVIDSQDDLPAVHDLLDKLPKADIRKVMLMPQAATRDELIAKSPMVADLCKKSGFAFCQRLHIMLWNDQKGT